MKSKSFNLKKWAKSRAGQQVFICIGFMIIPLLLLFLFTYFPFAEMIKFSFYKMKYTTPIDRREFVGWDNYLDVFRRKDKTNGNTTDEVREKHQPFEKISTLYLKA